MVKSHPTPKYPIRCAECGKKQVMPAIVHHQVQKNHDGRIYDLDIKKLPVTRCQACGEIYFTIASDDAIVAALREKLGLLTPEQIHANIHTLGMQQKQFAERLGVAAETLSRWINGTMIQSRAMDNLLRAYFGSNEVRENLMGKLLDRRFGSSVSLR